MDHPSGLIGRIVPVALFACLAAYFLVAGLRSRVRSKRLADLALFCGLAVFVAPERAFGLLAAERWGWYVAFGVLRVLLGLAGVALAAAALAARRRDGGVGVSRPVVGAGFSLVHLVAGVALLLFSSFNPPSAPWVYASPDGALRLTLPSRQWKPFPPPAGSGATVSFVRKAPVMQANVVVTPGQAAADFDRAAELFRYAKEQVSQTPTPVAFREGTNAAGNPYRYWAGMDAAPTGEPIFVAYSATWCPQSRTVVEVMFEGVPKMRSEAGKAAETEAFAGAAETICLSVDCPQRAPPEGAQAPPAPAEPAEK